MAILGNNILGLNILGGSGLKVGVSSEVVSAALTLAANAPQTAVTNNAQSAIPTASLELAANPPQVGITHQVTLPVAALALVANAPLTEVAPNTCRLPALSLTLTANAPETELASLIHTGLEYRLTGGATNSSVSASLGGVESSVSVVNAADHNLFSKVADSEAAAGSEKYRCFTLHNISSETIEEFGIYIGTVTGSSYTKIYIGLGTGGVNGTEQSISDEDTAPVDVTFVHATSASSPLLLPDLPADQHINIWVRRDVSVGAEGKLIDYVRLIPKAA